MGSRYFRGTTWPFDLPRNLVESSGLQVVEAKNRRLLIATFSIIWTLAAIHRYRVGVLPQAKLLKIKEFLLLFAPLRPQVGKSATHIWKPHGTACKLLGNLNIWGLVH